MYEEDHRDFLGEDNLSAALVKKQIHYLNAR